MMTCELISTWNYCGVLSVAVQLGKRLIQFHCPRSRLPELMEDLEEVAMGRRKLEELDLNIC